MARRIDPDAIEADRKKKRINVPVSDRHANMVARISAEKGFPSSKIVAYMVARGIEIENDGRLNLDRPTWPKQPTNPQYVAAAFSFYVFSNLIDMAESMFESINIAAASLFQLGFEDYLESESTDG